MDYFSEKSNCPKCGNTLISKIFKVKNLGQVIERFCHGCGYKWDELPLGANKNVKKTV